MLMEYWDNQKRERVTVSTDNPLPTGGSTPADGSITTSMIQDGAVTTDKLAPDTKAPAAGTADSTPWSGVTGKPSTFPPAAHTHTASQISDASAIGRSVLTAADAAAARSAIGAGTSSQNLSALTTAEATTGTDTAGRAITAAVLAGAINERTKNKAAIAALTPITDPATADVEAVATLLNQVVAALQE